MLSQTNLFRFLLSTQINKNMIYFLIHYRIFRNEVTNLHIEQLQAFVEISSSKSISVAAENLYIAQPSLSRSMKLLEEELGLTLLTRSSNGVRLTEAGHTLLPTIQEILYQINTLKQQANALNNSQQTVNQEPFRLCTLQSVADCILTSALEEIHRTFPDTKFQITIPDSSDPYHLPDLSPYDLFIGLNIGNTFDQAIQDSALQMSTIFVDGFSIVVNDRHPLAKRKIVSINDILDYSIILHNYDFSIESFYQKILTSENQNQTLDILLRSNNSRVISQLLLTSLSALITNNILAANDYEPIEHLVSVPIKNFKYHCFCLFHPDTPWFSVIQEIIRILQNARLKLLLTVS